jgi:hypothetical protein
MPMRIDETRHQCAATAIDNFRVRDRLRGTYKGFNELAFNEDILTFDKFAIDTIEDFYVLKQDRLCRFLSESWSNEPKRRGGKTGGDPFQNRSPRKTSVYTREELLCLRRVTSASLTVCEMPILATKTKQQAKNPPQF